MEWKGGVGGVLLTTATSAGLFQLVRGELDIAEPLFRRVLDSDPQFLPALLGKVSGGGKGGHTRACTHACMRAHTHTHAPPLPPQAHVQYRREQYSAAADTLSAAMQAHPSCPASVRVGFGLCMFKQGRDDVALAAMRRALELEVGGCVLCVWAVCARTHAVPPLPPTLTPPPSFRPPSLATWTRWWASRFSR